MKEVIRDFTGAELGPTYFRGSKPIDGIWATPDVQISNACVMPAGYGISVGGEGSTSPVAAARPW